MKFYTAALALCALAFAPAIADNTRGACEEYTDTEYTKLDFYNSQLVNNTLHLPGGELRFTDVGTYENQDLDIVVTIADDIVGYNGTDYVTGLGKYVGILELWRKKNSGNDDKWKGIEHGSQAEFDQIDRMNGSPQNRSFANINLQTLPGKTFSGRADLRVCIVKKDSDKRVTLPMFHLTTYDTDQRSNGVHEKIIMGKDQFDSYQFGTGSQALSEIEIFCENNEKTILGDDGACAEGERTVFASSTDGVGDDNPKTLEGLTPQQKARSMSFTFKNKACVEFTYDHYCAEEQYLLEPLLTKYKKCPKQAGGNFLFAGTSEEIIKKGECIKPPQTLHPTIAPVAPTEEPTEAPRSDGATVAPSASCGEKKIDVCVAIDMSGSICSSGNNPELCLSCDQNGSCDAGGFVEGGMCCENNQAVANFASQYIDALDASSDSGGTYSVVHFASNANVASGQGNANNAKDAISTTAYTGGYTNIEDAIDKCMGELRGKENPAIVLISDGTPTACTTANGSYKTRFQPTCSKDECADCPNGGAETAATTLADNASAAGMSLIPVVISSVSTTQNFLESLAKCPADSRDCVVENYKGLQVDSVESLNAVLEPLIQVTACPEVGSEAPVEAPVDPTDSPSTKAPFEKYDEPTDEPDDPKVDDTETPTESPVERTPDPTISPTEAPVAETDAPVDACPVEPPFTNLCPDDVELLHVNGDTRFDFQQSIKIVEQKTDSVVISLVNNFSEEGDVSQIWHQYKPDTWSEKCFEEQDVCPGSAYAKEIELSCHRTVAFALLEICVADGVVLGDADDAEVPKCCESKPKEGNNVACYKFEIACDSKCRRSLRGIV